ncbi:MAG: hypothetical protein ACRDHK_11525 [Actinomycetota bacterium]
MVRLLVRYTDWWQPASTSLLQVGAARRAGERVDGRLLGLLSTLDVRTELCRRMQFVSERDRHILFLWYVKQDSVEDIAREIGISRRQCFRRRAEAIRKIVRLGEDDEAA